jgi:hypothetical protein
VGGSSFFDTAGIALLSTGGGYLAAWPEVALGQKGSSVVRVVRLDGQGARLGPATAMRAPAPGFDEVEPSLLAFGDAVAVLWGRGTHIDICGGCVPDHRIDLVLIDPLTLDPLSDVATVTAKAGGLLSRRAAVLGADLLTTYLDTFHTSTTAGSAVFTCQKK